MAESEVTGSGGEAGSAVAAAPPGTESALRASDGRAVGWSRLQGRRQLSGLTHCRLSNRPETTSCRHDSQLTAHEPDMRTR